MKWKTGYRDGKIKKGLIGNHTSFVYEDICWDKMWKLNVEGVWPFQFSKVGRYWNYHTEIDISAIDPEGSNLIVGECKYRNEPTCANILYALEEKAAQVEWNKNCRKVWYVLFSISGFTADLEEPAKTRQDVVLVK